MAGFSVKNYSKDKLYDLFSRVIKDNGSFREENEEVNLLGIRRFKDLTLQEVDKNSTYDDIMAIVYKDKDGNKLVETFASSTAPSERNIKNKKEKGKACPFLINGQHKYYLSWHHYNSEKTDITPGEKWWKNGYPALKPIEPGVTVYRDNDFDGKISDGDKLEHNNNSINIHFGGFKNDDTQNWSLGCQTLVGEGKYKEFIKIVSKDPNIKRDWQDYKPTKKDASDGSPLYYTLVDGKEIEDACVSAYSLPVDIKDVDTTLEVTKEFINKYYIHNEQEFEGGYFPVGGNTSWHSGVHILAEDGAPVRAVADGEIVCARMPVADPNQEKLNYGSRNFVMIKHNTNEKIWYSVYYHLKSTSFDSEEAKEIVWWKSKSLKVTKNRNIRVIPGDKEEDIIRTIDTKNGPVTCEILGTDGDWIEVQDPETDRVGFILFASDRMEIIDSISQHYKDCFSEGDHVVQVNVNVSAGDIIGYVGEGIVLEDKKPVKKPLLHWTILSNELFDPNWLQVSDTDGDYTCNSKVLVNLVDKNDDDKLTVPEVVEYFGNEENAKKVRPYACKFTSEWAVDWKKFASKMKSEGVRAVSSALQMYNFWKDASECDSDIVSDGNVWHYNPITFLEKLLFATARATFSELFEPDRTFPLPIKLKKLGKKIGNYLSGATIKYIHFILHSGVEGDTLDAKELSQKRAEIIEGYFKPSVKFFENHIGKEKEWGDRERKIMMSYLKNPDGKSYGSFSANDDPVDDKFKEIVRKFQEDYSLKVDGDFGKGSLTKAVELLLEEIGMNNLPDIVVTVAGDNHKEESKSQESESGNNSENNAGSSEEKIEDTGPSKIMEVILWKDVIEPAVDEYEGDSAGVYEKWQSVVNLELEDALANAQFGIELYRPDDAKLNDDKFECVVDGSSKFNMDINNNGSPAILTVKGMKVSNDSLITLIRYPAEKLEAQYIFKDIPYSSLIGEEPDVGYFENEESEGDNNETTA